MYFRFYNRTPRAMTDDQIRMIFLGRRLASQLSGWGVPSSIVLIESREMLVCLEPTIRAHVRTDIIANRAMRYTDSDGSG